MIQAQSLAFLSALRENNYKEWFQENRSPYEAARNNFLDFTQFLIDGLADFDEEIGKADLNPKKVITRINRDIRFSKDKTPYKTMFLASMTPAGKMGGYAGYFFCLSPEGSFYGGGLYSPDNKILNGVREEIDQYFHEWLSIAEDDGIKTHFGGLKTNGSLSRPPKGFEKDNPAIEWIKRKGHYAQRMVSDAEVLHPDFGKQVLEHLKSLRPLNDFVNRTLAPLTPLAQ